MAENESGNELEKLIVENILDIEAAIARARDRLDDRLWDEMGEVVNEAVPAEDWDKECEGAGASFWLRNWGSGNPCDARFYFVIDKNDIGKEKRYTWLARSVSENDSPYESLALYFSQKVVAPESVKLIYEQQKSLLETLRKNGFRLDNGLWLYMPFTFKKEILAQAYKNGDFSEALQPLKEAVGKVFENRQQFEKLAEAFDAAADTAKKAVQGGN
ncbi:MAG: hypothetical protein GX772_05770 [Alcaligenaceae bacterium]|nr:hypothetical protein [Alcaligenaceae bacterium]